MDLIVRKALGLLLFAGLLASSATLSLAIAKFRFRTFGERLCNDVSILLKRAREHDVNISLTLPRGDYSLTFYKGSRTIRFVSRWMEVSAECEHLCEVSGRFCGGSKLELTSDGWVMDGG